MPRSSPPRIILGVDPGLADTGYGVVSQHGTRLTMLAYGSIKTKAGQPAGLRLKQIHQELQAIVEKYRPVAAGVEKLFFAKNAKTAMAVGQARGVIMMTLAYFNLPVTEPTPMEVKMGLTSYGKAGKKQVQEMVKLMLKLKKIPKPDDAADALAIAICCANNTPQ